MWAPYVTSWKDKQEKTKSKSHEEQNEMSIRPRVWGALQLGDFNVYIYFLGKGRFF